MTIEHFMIGIVVERRAGLTQWADWIWTPVQALPAAPDIAPMTSLGMTSLGKTSLGMTSPGMAGERERFYLGSAEVSLFSADTAHFRDNFNQAFPQLWVSIRLTGLEPPVELVGVTADPHEGEGYGEQIGDIVEPVPMPPEIVARVQAFFAEHHVEREFFKRKREEFDPRKGGQRRGPQPSKSNAS
jgi:Protein of unknown function (DUF3305)